MRRRRNLLLVAILSLLFSVVCHFLLVRQSRIAQGFLTKDGAHYRIGWKEEQQFLSRRFDTLKQALNFAQEVLELEVGRNVSAAFDLEFIEVRKRNDATIVYWKPYTFPFLSRLTFQNHDEALYFAQAFRRGSYSPSPFGHSLLLLAHRQ